MTHMSQPPLASSGTPRLPEAYIAEFSELTLVRNLQRIKVLCWAMMLSYVIFGLSDYHGTSRLDTPDAWSMFRVILVLRMGMATLTGCVLFLMTRAGKDRPWRGWLEFPVLILFMLYMGVILGLTFHLRFEISIYILFVIVGGSFMHLPPGRSGAVFLCGFGSLCISLPLFGAPWEEYKSGIVIAAFSTAISYFLSRITYANLLRDFLNAKYVERQNRELVTARLAAESADRAKTEFLTTMSHELRTPLNSVLGMSEYLATLGGSSEQMHCVNSIRHAGEHLLGVINNILDFRRIESGKLEVEQVPMDLKSILDKVHSVMRPLCKAKGLACHRHVAGNVTPTRLGDPTRLQQVLVNLVGNAVKFTSKGSVGISLSRAEADDETSICLEVRDTGEGIPADKQEQVFEPFAQADSSTTRRHGGSGLGLAITRKLVQAMGGTIVLESVPGQGSRFAITLSLPLCCSEEESGPVTHAGSPMPEDFSGIHVLVVEDFPPNQKLMGLHLGKAGARVSFADNGRRAVELVLLHSFDLIFMDVEMPVMDGLEATRLIRSHEQEAGLNRIPIIALTAHALEEYRRLCLESGFDDFLTKPFLRMDLLGKLHQHLSDREDQPDAPQEGEAEIDAERERNVARAQADDPVLVTGTPRIARVFWESVGEGLSQDLDALDQESWERLRHLAHSIQGAATVFGFFWLYRKGRELSEALHADDKDRVREILEQMRRHHREADVRFGE